MTYFKKLVAEFVNGSAKDKLGIVADLIQVAGFIIAIPFVKKLISAPAMDVGISIFAKIVMGVWFFLSLIMLWAIWGLHSLLKHPLTTTGMTEENFKEWKNGSGKHKVFNNIENIEALTEYLSVKSNYSDFEEHNKKLPWLLGAFAIISFIVGIAPLIIYW